MKPKKWSEEELEFLKNNYKNMTHKELSEVLGRTKSAVINKQHQLGLVKSKYKYNKQYFKNIDTNEKAYWLGFIYADGYVSYNEQQGNYEFGIKLQKSDQEHLKKLNKCLDGNVPVATHKRQTFLHYGYDKYYEGCSIRFYSKEMVLDLMDKGVIQNKTYDLKFPTQYSDEFTWHFIRGFMDGDGHICEPNSTGYGYRVGFTCISYDFLNDLKTFFNKYGIVSHINLDKKNGHTYKLEIRNKESICKYFDNCYKNSEIYLDRKYKKYKILEELLH